MPIRAAADGPRHLAWLIDSLGSALRRRSVAVAATWATAGALAAAAGLMALDWSDAAPDFPRAAVYGAAGAAALAAVAGAALAAWRRRPSPLYVARLIETQRPELKNAVLTFVELAADPSADPSMTAAVGRRAAAILARDDPERFLPPLAIRRPLAALLAAGALTGGMLWLGQGTRIRPWVASADAGLMATAAISAQPRAHVAQPAPNPAANAAGGPKETIDHRAAASAAADKTPAAKPSPTEGAADTAAAQALAPAVRADAKTFDRLAAALAAGGAPGAQGNGAGYGTLQQGGDVARGGSADPRRGPADGRRARAAHAATDAKPSPGPGGAAAAKPAPPRAAGGAKGARPRKTPTVSPLPDHDPSGAVPENALDAMRRAKRLIEEADRRLRDGEVTDAFLGRMGVGNAEFRRFVVAWQRRFEAAAAGPRLTRPPREVRSAVGTTVGKVLRPAGGSEAAPVAGPVHLEPDGRKESVQGAAPQVGPRLQPAVRAYFRAIDRLTAQPGDKEPPP